MTGRGPLQVSVLAGPAIADGPAGGLAAAWDALFAAAGDNVGGCSAWVLPTVCAAGPDGWGVVVRSADGTLTAAGFFVDVERDGVRTATLAGSDSGYWGALPAIDAAAAEALAEAVAAELDRRGVAADFGPLPAEDAIVVALMQRQARSAPSAVIPQLCRGGSDDVRDYLSPGMRKTLRKAHNRMVTDGVEPRIDVITDPLEVGALLPAMEAVYRGRDHRAGRDSPLDVPARRALWRGRILQLLGRGQGEVAVLWLNEHFSAYAVGLKYGGWYGLGEGRFETEHSRYTPGRYLEAAVLQRVLWDAGLRGVDWMSGVAPETLLAWNGASPTVRLVRPQRLAQVPRPRLAEDVTAGAVGAVASAG